jgi:hypothetical protein
MDASSQESYCLAVGVVGAPAGQADEDAHGHGVEELKQAPLVGHGAILSRARCLLARGDHAKLRSLVETGKRFV